MSESPTPSEMPADVREKVRSLPTTAGVYLMKDALGRVIYVEPYPKSRVAELHDDAVALGDVLPLEEDPTRLRKVRFEPFIGIAPHMHRDLFSFLPRKWRDLKEERSGPLPWSVVPWRLAATADLRASLIGDEDPLFGELEREAIWDLATQITIRGGFGVRFHSVRKGSDRTKCIRS